MAKTLDELRALVNTMTHRQLVRYLKTLKGGSVGFDYMKESRDDMVRRVNECVYSHTPEDASAKFEAAFPEGLYMKGQRRNRQSFGNGAATMGVIPTIGPQQIPIHEAASVARHAEANNSAVQDALATLMSAMAPKASVDADQVRAIVLKELEGIVLPVTVQISTNKGEPRKLEGIHHRRFPQLLAMLNAGLNVWLAGPAGTGKTTAAHRAAEALSLPFYFNGAIDNEYKLLGFTDAQGRVVSRPFRKAYEEGGVYLFDEVDASMPSAVLAFNAALANGSCDFPDKNVSRHPEFRVIAAANTWGHGANSDYVGRTRMDGAFLDRFVSLAWELDEVLERHLAGNDKWVTYVQDVRKRVHAKGLKVIISPRASIHGSKMLASGMSWEEAQEACLRRGMSDEQWAGIRS